jgi:transposase InsO family protein
MCELVGVSRAGYYRQWAVRAPDEEEMEVRAAIEEIALRHGRHYGRRRITAELRDHGLIVNHKRVARLMREDQLLAVRQRRFVFTTDSDHELEVYCNLAARMQLTGINQLWVADITYIRLQREFVFLAVILDRFSRAAVGWWVDRSLSAKLAVEALKQAIERRAPPPGLVHHSDRGVQYAARAYVDILQQHGITPSMSRPARPDDNAVCERFIKTLKQEEIYCREYVDLPDLTKHIDAFIGEYYNRQRLHSALDYRTPEAFERSLSPNPGSKLPSMRLSFSRHGEIYRSDEGQTL